MKKLFFIFLFITALAPLALHAQSDPVQVITPGTVGEVITNPCQEGAGEYCLLEPIPFGDGNLPFSKIDSSTGLGSYLQTLFKILLGIIGVLAVVMIIVGGVQYMTTDAIGGKENGKETVLSALGGLVLALGSWLILNTINPDLVSFKLDVKEVSVKGVVFSKLPEIQTVSSSDYQSVTGKKVLTQGEYVAKAASVAQELGVHTCAILTILAYESNGNPGAIGHDENVTSTSMANTIKSRRSFVAGTQTYSGAQIPAGTVVTSSKVNDDSGQLVNGKLQLDGRFSHGIGLTQITFFPEPWVDTALNWNEYRNKPLQPRSISYAGHSITLTPESALDADTNLLYGGILFKAGFDHCGGNIEQTWRSYASGSCTGTATTAVKRTATYNQCLVEYKP